MVQARAAGLLGIKKGVMKYKLDKYPEMSLDLQALETEGGLSIQATKFIPPTMNLNEVLETIEKKMIQRALERSDQVQAHAAEMLNIKKSVMQYKMKKYKL